MTRSSKPISGRPDAFRQGPRTGDLHQHRAHAEAVARISWCIAEECIGVVTGECGSGKTAWARAATSTPVPEPSRDLPGHARDRRQRNLRRHLSALGRTPSFHNAALIPRPRKLGCRTDERGRPLALVVTRPT